EIEDNGPGIPEEIQRRVFEPFFTTKAVGEGTGMGLDIVKRIVDRHQGLVSVESVTGRTCFRTCLPIYKA
ncbi:MAG: ATP-binding protein, partial [Bacteroidota bacterium]